jgi:chromosome segregation ATPase
MKYSLHEKYEQLSKQIDDLQEHIDTMEEDSLSSKADIYQAKDIRSKLRAERQKVADEIDNLYQQSMKPKAGSDFDPFSIDAIDALYELAKRVDECLKQKQLGFDVFALSDWNQIEKWCQDNEDILKHSAIHVPD